MGKRSGRRQLWPDPYRQILIEVLIILTIWIIVQGDPHHILQVLMHVLSRLS
jgi:hypothetical protein